MLSIGLVLALCAGALAGAADRTSLQDHIQLLNTSSVDKILLTRLASALDSNKTDVNTLVSKLKTIFNLEPKDVELISSKDVKEEDKRLSRITSIEESPDYASSVVLASDLLSLTSAVGNVKGEACRSQGFKLLDGLLMNKRWALRMFDASAKSPQGLLIGSSYHMGNFDECIDISEPGDDGATVQGQYCLATIQWTRGEASKQVRTGRGGDIRWAVCVPSACDARAVGQFVSDVLAATVGNTTAVGVSERSCYSRKPLSVSRLDVGFLFLILLFMVILFMSTVYEYVAKRRGHKSSVVHDIIVSFSIINNCRKLLSTKQNNSLGLDCIAGIKAISMIFIVSGHACLFISAGPVMDPEAWDQLLRNPANGFMLNNTLLVDTFLMLSAFLFCRLLLVELDKRRGKLNVLPILIFRYVRVTPAYLVVILFYMTWLPKVGEGPMWEDRMMLEQARCQQSWWANILYINNFVNTDSVCMFQSWYLSVDTQLFFLAPVFIYSLWYWRRIGPILLSISTIISMVVPSVITYKDKLDPALLIYAKEFSDISSNYYFKEAYIKTYMKTTPYFMGLATAYILHRIQSVDYQLTRLVKAFGWTTGIILGTISVFSISVFYQPWYEYSALEAAAYTSLNKLAWSIANGWLIVACATGNGGIFGKLLTYKLFVPLSRLTFCAYLVNGIVELYYMGQLRHPVHLSFLGVTGNAISHGILTFTLAVFLCLTFESPIHGIEKVLLKSFVRPKDETKSREETTTESPVSSQSKLES